MSTNGNAATLSAVTSEAVSALRGSVRGEVIQQGDPTYDAARALYNAMIDKHPQLIVQCLDVADVMAAVRFASDNQLEVAIRGGGHNGPGFASVEGGLVVDLSRMRSVRVDPSNGTVRVEGGALWGDVDHATHAFGLAVPCGFLSSTGVGGLTLGGGVGYLTRSFGLTIDSLLGVDMVLADGQFVTANATDNPDLYWAVRGGGGNFGVVTSFLFQGHPVHTVYGGPMMWPMDQALDVLKYWQEFITSAPHDINGWFGFVTVPPGPPFPEAWHMHKMAAVVWCCTAPLDEAETRFKSIREAIPPTIDFAGPIPFPALNNMFDALYPAGLQWYWRSDFFKHFDDTALGLHRKYGAQLPTMHSTMHIYPINGAAGEVSKDATAWAHRDANFAQVTVGVDPDPANNERTIAWAKDYWLALHPYSSGGSYVNMMMDEGEERVKAAYDENMARLAQVKSHYDPDNFFHVNQNIKPTK